MSADKEPGSTGRNLLPMPTLSTMIVQPRQQRSRTRRRRLGRSAVVTAARQAQAGPVGARERAAGGPQDQARYQCACGCVFEAPVSTTVSCPRCGGAQAW